MTGGSVNHATIIVERTYDAPPERVFAAWSSVEALLRWNAMGDGWHAAYDHFDFRVGGAAPPAKPMSAPVPTRISCRMNGSFPPAR